MAELIDWEFYLTLSEKREFGIAMKRGEKNSQKGYQKGKWVLVASEKIGNLNAKERDERQPKTKRVQVAAAGFLFN